MANAFAAITKSAADVTPKSTTKKITASVTKSIQATVDTFVNNKAQIKALEAAQADAEAVIIEHVRPQQDEHAFRGDFSKSFLVPGNTTNVTYNTRDSFSVPQDEETLKEVRKITGEKKYSEFFTSKPSIGIKSSILTNDAVMNKIAAACEKAGLSLGEIFESTVKVIAQDDLDVKQYTLPKEKLPLFRALVRQSKPALK
jgi:hypothetical protein